MQEQVKAPIRALLAANYCHDCKAPSCVHFKGEEMSGGIKYYVFHYYPEVR
jgi:hypothetical protein